MSKKTIVTTISFGVVSPAIPKGPVGVRSTKIHKPYFPRE